MIHALVASMVAALLSACLVRAIQPGNLLAFLTPVWVWWIIFRPGWLPRKASGDCAFCTSFWVPGVPVALLAAGGAGWWALCVPFLVAVLTDKLLAR